MAEMSVLLRCAAGVGEFCVCVCVCKCNSKVMADVQSILFWEGTKATIFLQNTHAFPVIYRSTE
jgi:hypothetical protein